jgi:hypothetical protein
MVKSKIFPMIMPSLSFEMVCYIVMVHFIPYTKTIIGKRTTKLFLDHVFQYHGLLENIISNHKLQFVSKF